jgi:hypothetical protein
MSLAEGERSRRCPGSVEDGRLCRASPRPKRPGYSQKEGESATRKRGSELLGCAVQCEMGGASPKSGSRYRCMGRCPCVIRSRRCAWRPSPLSTRHDSSPVFFAAPGKPYSISFPRGPETKCEGARDAKGPEGPTDLDASRHRGLSKSDRAASPPDPRRPARGVSRLAPHRPRWTDLSGAASFEGEAPFHRWRGPRDAWHI